jgi:predicted ATPase
MNDSNNITRIIFTGTPGSGKTSVIYQLQKIRHMVIHEAATDVIALQQANGIAKPWEEPGFIDAITKIQRDRQINAIGDLQFYDRSPFCTYALGSYLAHHQKIEFNPSPLLMDEIERCLKEDIYKKDVCFFENLGLIEHTDARQISYEDALTFEKTHLDVYRKFGFNTIMVPKELTIQQRCEHILTISS